MREIYFDNAATTVVNENVIELMNKVMREDYGNPSSKHIMGVNAEKYVRESSEIIAATLKVKPKEIIFTSGGTESNNMALIGSALARQRLGRHIITTGIEHASVYQPIGFLESMGFEVDAVRVDNHGHVDLEHLESILREDTILVSTMMVNNEIGTIEPVEEISKLIRTKSKNAIYHVDAIQAYGKMNIYPKRLGIDLLSVSSHKLHGPKGMGFLYIDENVKIRPIILGGGQQSGMRSGTLNVPGIAGMGLAAQNMYDALETNRAQMFSVKDHMIDEVTKIDGVTVNSLKGEASAPNIVSVSIEGVRAEVLLHALEDKGIYVSSGSACSSHHPGISGTLKGIGLKDSLLDSTIRVSLNENNTIEDADALVSAMKELIPMLRRFTRK